MNAAVIGAPRPGSSAAPLVASPGQRPDWLPAFVPEFDGLRGLAILSVVLYHCQARLQGTFLERFVIWGWIGVILFFVLSGFLLTATILDSGSSPRFYSNFYARRFLRVWPVYWLLLFLHYFFFPLIFSGYRWMLHDIAAAPWLILLLLIQNLWTISLPGAIGPTWFIAVYQQFFLLWTPLARRIPPRRLLLVAAVLLAASPLVRLFYGKQLSYTHSLIHLDGLALGSMLAIALRVLPWPPALWRWVARAALCVGAAGVLIMIHHGSAFTDTLLAVGFGGMLLSALLGHAACRPTLYCRVLNLRPFVFVGTISYSLCVTHILVFSVLGGYVDKPLDRFGIPGNLAIVAIRLAASIGFASLVWIRFEKPILALKRHFNFRQLSAQ